MDIYFILCVITQYYFAYFIRLFLLWPLGALSVDSGILLTCPIIVVEVLFQQSLTFYHCKMLQVDSEYSLS